MLNAELNHGRWIVRCGKCPAAELLRGTEFVCSECGSRARVRIPQHYAEITELTNRRPLAETRNWIPGETLRDLRRENEDHGVDSA